MGTGDEGRALHGSQEAFELRDDTVFQFEGLTFPDNVLTMGETARLFQVIPTLSSSTSLIRSFVTEFVTVPEVNYGKEGLIVKDIIDKILGISAQNHSPAWHNWLVSFTTFSF